MENYVYKTVRYLCHDSKEIVAELNAGYEIMHHYTYDMWERPHVCFILRKKKNSDEDEV